MRLWLLMLVAFTLSGCFTGNRVVDGAAAVAGNV